jgi:hypothetical protein
MTFAFTFTSGEEIDSVLGRRMPLLIERLEAVMPPELLAAGSLIAADVCRQCVSGVEAALAAGINASRFSRVYMAWKDGRVLVPIVFRSRPGLTSQT